jgi:hypothetical protein
MRNRFGWCLLVLCLPTLSACAGPIRYSNPTATPDRFVKDRYDCYRETAQRVEKGDRYGVGTYSELKPNCSAFNACLAARGYFQLKDGNLEVPASDKIDCN